MFQPDRRGQSAFLLSDEDGILSVCGRIQLGGHLIKVQSYKLYGLEDM